ncbi:phage tail tape measure protein [Francisella philomiragia]|uniref:Phage tail tape measure protein n=1 Tax=Francisella philomiragia TaxID=28110 RepID=A0ABS1GCV0_9GAMM|nr:hypothetical protein [Francisella philomiragia]MBK2258976.1 hypothetical protein [Francisella philomiragia]MBK2302667.1 hypothetical protein [Francisella philomiragia]
MQQNKKINFSIGGSIGTSFNGAVGGVIKKLDHLAKREESIRSKQTLIGKFYNDQKAVGRLSETLKTQKASLADLQASYNATGGTSEKLKLKIQQAKDSILETTKELRNQKNSSRSARHELKKLGVDTNHVKDEEKRLRDELERTQKTMKIRSEGFNAIGKSIKTLGKSFIVATTASIGFAAASYRVTSSTANHGSEIERMSKKLGTATNEYQKLRYAALVTDTGIDKLDGSLEEMQIRLSDAMIGDGQAVEALEQLNLSATELYNLKPEQALGVIADALGKVQNKKQKIWLADALFGGEGVDMLKMLDKGSQGLKKYGEEAENVGYILDEKSLKAARDNKVAFQQMTASLQSVGYTIGNALMPIFTDFFKKVTSWISNNQEKIKGWGETAITYFKSAISILRDLGKGVMFVFGDSTIASIIRWSTLLTGTSIGGVVAISKLIKVFSAFRPVVSLGVLAVKSLGGSIKFLAKMSAPLLTKGLRLGIVALGWASSATGTAIKALGLGIKFLGRAMLTNPIGLAVTALIGVVSTVWYFRDEITGAFKKAWDGIKYGWDIFTGWLSGINQALGDPLGGIINIFIGAWENIKSIFQIGSNAISGIFSLMTGDFDSASQAFSNVFDGITGIFQRGIDFLKDKLSWLSDSFDWLSKQGSKIKGWFSSWWGDDEKEIQATKTTKFASMDEIARKVQEQRANNVTNDNKSNNVQLHNTITIQGNASPKEMEEAIRRATMPLYGNALVGW